MSGDPYIKENEELRAEIARLTELILNHEASLKNFAWENRELRAALEAARTEYRRIKCTPSSIIAAIERALAKEGK